MNLKHLTDSELLKEAKNLVSQEQELLVKVLHHLKEIERRRLFSSLGFNSLFTYAVKQLGYSEDQAQRRISAMRLMRELPQVQEKIQTGQISLTNLCMAQSMFRREEKIRPMNKEQKILVLEKLVGRTSRDAEKIVIQNSSEESREVLTKKAENIRVLAENAVEIKFIITEELRDKIETLKGLMAHSCPNIDLAELIDKLCDLGMQKWNPSLKGIKSRKSSDPLLESDGDTKEPVKASEQKDKALLEREPTAKNLGSPFTSPAAPQVSVQQNTQRLTAETKRHVWQKAQSQCENCNSKYALQVDHIVPRAMGGLNELQNLRLLCRNCNQRAAIEYFGAKKMEKHLGSKNRPTHLE
jgi:hypothetical protein